MSGLDIQNLSKRYGATQALSEVNLNLAPGKIYGLLGRNGAGKTTLLNIVTGRVFADSGQVLLDGARVLENDEALRQISMQGEQTLYPEGMRVRDALRWTGRFYPRFDAGMAADFAGRFGLDTSKKVGSLSTGYSTIFKLVATLATRAPYLILDEPVLGLDANHRALFYQLLLARYAEEPCCVVLSTHLVEEVSALVEDVVILKEGRVITNEPRDSLLAEGYTLSGPAAALDAFLEGRQVLGADVLGGLKTAAVLGQRPDALPEGLEMAGLDLQQLFIRLTN